MIIKIFAILFIYSFRLIGSLFFRGCYWLKYKFSKNKEKYDNEIKRLKSVCINKKQIDKELKIFQWVNDPIEGLIDWSPSIYSFLINEKKDDCDGAGFYTRWLFKNCSKENGKVKIISLISKFPFIGASHVIAILKYENKFFVYSNGICINKSFGTEKEAVTYYINNSKVKYFKNYIPIYY